MKKRKYLFFAVILLFVLFFLSLINTSKVIGNNVGNQCVLAQEKYKKDCVNSLIMLVDNENEDFRSRNSAIWALGQLGDKQAKEVLLKYKTGVISKEENLDKEISQLEVKKALELLQGSFNLSSFVFKLF